MLNTKYCHWYEDEDGAWHTDCEKMFVLNTGTPTENKMRYCCYCSKGLVEVKYKEEE
jgi:hypothetical protein